MVWVCLAVENFGGVLSLGIRGGEERVGGELDLMGYADIAEDVGAGTGIKAGVDVVCGVAFEEGEGGGDG